MTHLDQSGADLPCGCREGQLSLEEIEADFARREARLRRRPAFQGLTHSVENTPRPPVGGRGQGEGADARGIGPSPYPLPHSGEGEQRPAFQGLTRRELLEVMAAGAAAAALSSVSPAVIRGEATPELPPAAPPADRPRSRVVVVTHPEVILKEYRVNPAVIRAMLDRALVDLTGAKDVAEAWRQVGREDDFVVIKHNTMGRPTLESHTEINDAVSAQLTALAKVKADRILAVDRTYPPPFNEFSEPFTLPSRKLETRLRRLYTDKEGATAIINVSVLKSHFSTGLSAAMKNHLGSINNPAMYHGWEPDRMPLSIPELNALEPIRTKTRLVIIDAIRPLFDGGPTDNPEFRWDYHGLIVSRDPVAASATGMRILEAKRAEVRKGPWPMAAAQLMMAHAQKIGLGNADADRIDLVEAKMG
jgi:hypothetical protein